LILVDTSVWVDHLQATNSALVRLLEDGQVLSHPFVIGEIALGNLKKRNVVLQALESLPRASVALDREILGFIDRNFLFGLGIGYVDAHLLAATRLMADARLWTADRRLQNAAERLNLAATPTPPRQGKNNSAPHKSARGWR
jgi:predicted nucleic acid-binding protein